jgi:hypothetical protein
LDYRIADFVALNQNVTDFQADNTDSHDSDIGWADLQNLSTAGETAAYSGGVDTVVDTVVDIVEGAAVEMVEVAVNIVEMDRHYCEDSFSFAHFLNAPKYC